MSFSGGAAPRIWVPSRPAGLGGVPGRSLIPPGTGTSEDPAAAAKGYVTARAADGARSTFRQVTGIDAAWVPTTPAEIGPWAKEQAVAWATPEMRRGIDAGRRMLEQKLSGNGAHITAPAGSPFSESDAAAWATGYLAMHGAPTTTDAAVRMAQDFVASNSDAIGIPPEYIAAANLIQNFPSTVEDAGNWGLELGTAYLSQYGVPIVTSTDVNQFLASSGRAAIAQVAPGIPYSLCEATYSSLANGSINFGEAQGIVIGACAWIGGAIGQAFGLPAPIGALLAQVIASELVPIVAAALGFGPSASEKLNAAQDQARKAADAATVICTDMARALWLNYQHYWETLETDLDQSMRGVGEWLYSGGGCGVNDGLRLFPETTPGANTLDIVRGADGTPLLANPNGVKQGQPPVFVPYQHPLARTCLAPVGCTYLSYPIDPVVRRADYALSMDALRAGVLPAISQGAPGCDALSALAFWGARRYVTPFQPQLAMMGQESAPEQYGGPSRDKLPGRPNMWLERYAAYSGSQLESGNALAWDAVLHSDEEYLKLIGTVTLAGKGGDQVGPCVTTAWGRYLFSSLQQAASASALVQRDLARTVSMGSTQYGIQSQLEQTIGNQWAVADAADRRQALRVAAANAATFRSAVLAAKRRGAGIRDMLNYGLLVAGGGALAGWAARRSR